MGTCHLCDDHPDDPDLLNHVRLMHPDQYDDPERWPDGRIVIHDLTPDPTDIHPDTPL